MEQDRGLAIEAHGLRRVFGDVVAVDDVDLAVERGDLVSILGPNGAGKTTTIRMLCCLLRPTAGSATVGGHDISTDPMAVKETIAVSPQETAIAEHLDAWENLSLMARLHGLDKGETRRRSERLLEMLGLGQRAGDRVRKYSGGMKRRLSIAMALVSEPQILFLDEPTLGLDPQSRRGLWEHIATLKGDTTIVLTTHYLEEADQLADRIVVIDEGCVVAEGTPDELKALVPGGRAACLYVGVGMLIGAVVPYKAVTGPWMAVLLLTIFGGTWVNLEDIGGVFESAATWFPFAHALDAIRAVMLDGAGGGDIATDLLWVVGYTVASIGTAVVVFRRKMLA